MQLLFKLLLAKTPLMPKMQVFTHKKTFLEPCSFCQTLRQYNTIQRHGKSISYEFMNKQSFLFHRSYPFLRIGLHDNMINLTVFLPLKGSLMSLLNSFDILALFYPNEDSSSPLQYLLAATFTISPLLAT